MPGDRGNKLTRKSNTKGKSDDQGQLKKSFKVINYQATVVVFLLKGFKTACEKCTADAAATDFTAWMHSEPVSVASQVPFSSCPTRSVDIFEVNSHRQNYRFVESLQRGYKDGETRRKTFI